MAKLFPAGLILCVIQLTLLGAIPSSARVMNKTGVLAVPAALLSLNIQDESSTQILSRLADAGVKTYTNTPDCLKSNTVGMYKSTNLAIILCTNRMKSFADDSSEYQELLGATIAHEAIHAVQHCRFKKSRIPYLGVSTDKLYELPISVQSDIKKSVKVSNYSAPWSVAWRIEAEAYYHEERPDEVIEKIKFYCFR